MQHRTTRFTLSTRTSAMLVAAVTAGAVLATTGAAHAADLPGPARSASGPVASADGGAGLDGIGTEDEVLTGIEEALTVLTDIPDEVLAQGDEATVRYLQKRMPAETGGGIQVMKFSAAGCARGILLAIGSNIFAAAKIYKMKKAIDKLGGIKKVVAKIRSKKKAGKTFKKGITEVFEEAGAGIGGMAAGILGVDGVIKHCW
ncbi:hypothetical protein [Streptomyces sp. NPDC029526]|uniref:hypothetical protein n=1 Tax=Streptomyces sp. NPDC029526 TaxID=3155728 RepID=UPI0033E179DD